MWVSRLAGRRTSIAFAAEILAALLIGVAGAAAAQSPTEQAGPGRGRPAASSASTFENLAAKANAARDAEHLDEAVPLFKKALALNPKWAEGWWSLATIYYDADRYAEGAIAFERVARLKPEDGTTHLMLGLCLYELNQDQQAGDHFALARKYGIQNAREMEPVLVYHEAMVALRLGRFETANQTLRLLTRKGVHSEEINLAYGMSVLMMRPVALPPPGTAERAVVLRVGEAEAADSIETHEQARDLYARAVAATPEFPNIHFAFGRFLLGIQEPDAALVEFQQELKLNPGNIRAKLEVAAIDYRTDSAAGIPYAEEVVRMSPRYPFAHYLLGLLCLDAGEVPRAITELETARSMVPTEPQFSFALANAYAKAHRKEDAAAARAEFVRLRAKAQEQEGPTYYDAGGHTALHIGNHETTTDQVH